MSKQDRQGVRTAADVERKYNFGKSFSEVMGVAEKAVETAEKAASGLDEKLTSEEIFNRLTNNGQLQGLYRGDDGELYINASFLATGVISSADGTVKLDIGKNVVTIDGQINDGGTVRKTRMELSVNGLVCYVEDDTFGGLRETLSIVPGGEIKPTSIYNEFGDGGLMIGTMDSPIKIGESTSPLSLWGSYVDIDSPLEDIRILGKSVYWKPNGDGTSSLVTSD